MRYLLVLIPLLFVSCTSESNRANRQKEAVDQLRKGLDSLFNEKIKSDEPGAALMVAYDGELLVGKGYGLRNLETKTSITASTNMRLASVSKQFTALTILALVDEGKLKLSDDIDSYLALGNFKGVTIEQLINHTSGLADAEAAFFSPLVWKPSKIAVNADILPWYDTDNKRINEPGEVWRYNNGAYELLPLIVEKVSGESFDAYAKKVLNKAGMKDSNFFDPTRPVEISERANCYQKDQNGDWQQVDGHFLNGLLGAGGLYTNVNDFFRYDQALRNKEILSRKSHQLIFQESANNGERGYGMGWFLGTDYADHSGGWMGTNTYTKRWFGQPLTYAIFMNSNTMGEKELVQETNKILYAFYKAMEEINK